MNKRTTAVRIIGSGSYLPDRKVSNAELTEQLSAAGIETSDAWIRARTGIEYRHFAAQDQKSSDLATIAAKRALEQANLSAQDIDLIIVATSTPDMIFPSTACQVQYKINNIHAAAFDVQAVCSGFVYAITLADSLMQTGTYRHALVIGSELFSHILDFQDRSTCVLFGDGAGAVVLKSSPVLRQDDTAVPISNMHSVSSQAGMIDCEIAANGQYYQKLWVPGTIQHGKVTGDPFVRMDGQIVFKFAVNVLCDCAEKLLQRQALNVDALDWVIPHQANIRIMMAVNKRLGIPKSKTVATVSQHANTSAASIPLALDIAIKDGRIQPNDVLLLLGVGGGFTWGGVLLCV